MGEVGPGSKDWTGVVWPPDARMAGSDVTFLRKRVLLEHLAVLIRSTRLPDDCDIGNPASFQDTCSLISCLQDILRRHGACETELEKTGQDCLSLDKVSAALSTVSKQYRCEGEFYFNFSRNPIDMKCRCKNIRLNTLKTRTSKMPERAPKSLKYSTLSIFWQLDDHHLYCISGTNSMESTSETSEVKDKKIKKRLKMYFYDFEQ